MTLELAVSRAAHPRSLHRLLQRALHSQKISGQIGATRAVTIGRAMDNKTTDGTDGTDKTIRVIRVIRGQKSLRQISTHQYRRTPG